MKMKIFPGILIIFMVTMGVIFFLQNNDEEKIINQPLISSPSPTEVVKSVSLPQSEDIIRVFFALIDEKKIPEAVNMMSKINTQNDSTRQAWGVQFNAIKSVKLLEMKPYWQEEWTSEMQEYMVSLDMQIDPSSKNAIMPYYGYQNGKNIRFLILKKENNLWKIDGIATGP